MYAKEIQKIDKDWKIYKSDVKTAIEKVENKLDNKLSALKKKGRY